MSDLRAMQRLCGLMRKAVQDYEMIAPGDRVMVGVSGGKDSVALTIGLSMLRKYIGFDYEVVAVTLDPQFDHQPMDYSALAELFRQHGIPYEVRRTEIGPVVFEYRKEKNPCALCAKLRRGALHTAAQELGCNKVALGIIWTMPWRPLYGTSGGRDASGWLLAGTLPLQRDYPHPSHAAGNRVRGAVRRAGGGLAHREEPLPRRRRYRAGTDQRICAGALPHRPRLPPKDSPCFAGERH